MQFETFAEFFDMGGHGLYVWLSYALAIAVLALNFVIPLLKKKSLIVSLQRRIALENSKK